MTISNTSHTLSCAKSQLGLAIGFNLCTWPHKYMYIIVTELRQHYIMYRVLQEVFQGTGNTSLEGGISN